MDDFQSVFEHLPQHRIIRCRKCRYAPIPKQVPRHLGDHHAHLSAEHRRSIAESVLSLLDLAHVAADVIYPLPGDPPVSGFPVYYDGFSCHASDRCQYVCRNRAGIKKHSKDEHGWVNQQKRGGDPRLKQPDPTNKIWKSNRACQRFFKVGDWQRYFEVAVPRSTDSGTAGKNVTKSFFLKQKESLRSSKEEASKAANRVQGFESHCSTVVPWLRTTGIAAHIHGLKKDEIHSAFALPAAREECVLQCILESTERMLRKAHSWCFDGSECMLTWPCRVVLGRFQLSQAELSGATRAFEPNKEPFTLKAYFRIAKQFLAYFDRVANSREHHFSATGEAVRPEDVIDLTNEQRTTWCRIRRLARQKIDDSRDRDQGDLETQLLRMWMLLICHDTGARRYRSPLLSFYAMLSIKPTDLCWVDPGNLSSHLSAIIWIAQLLIFYDSACRELAGEDSTLQLVKRCCDNYLQQTSESPMGEILRWRLLLFRVSKDTVQTRQGTWDESEEVLTYDGTELHMDQIPTLLLSEYNDCCRLLYEDLMLGSNKARRMHAWDLKDNPNIHVVDWSFLHHRDNEGLLIGSESALLATIEESPHLCKTFLTQGREDSTDIRWRDSALASYDLAVQDFLKRLSTLIHISAGTPVRENEFMSMTWRNTQRPRSITVQHSRIMIHLTYHKGQQQSGKYRDNIRFLAQPIADLLLDYIVYVMPLRQIFQRQASPTKLISPFLWEKKGKVWPESKLTRCLEEASVRAQIPRLHISNWRQMTVAIVKTKFAADVGCFEIDADDEDGEELEQDIQALTKQRNHKTRTVNRAYANQTGATFGNVWDGLIRMGLRASTIWQNFWGVDTLLSNKKRKRSEEESRLTKRIAKGPYRPKKSWPTEALLGGLQRLYKDEEVRWKSAEQQQAMAMIMSWTEQVVAILPTGGGKSILFMLPCTLPDARSTILVLPLVSLRVDLIRRMSELKIDYLVWLPGEQREARLIIVTVEAACTKDFLRYAQALIANQKLDRVVVDECHLTVTAARYRAAMIDLGLLRGLRTQFVYLTATLPPVIQTEFEQQNHLYHPSVVRASSNRPNVFYMVRQATVGNGSLLEQSAAEARDAWFSSELFDKARDKVLVYVRTRAEAVELSDLLECDFYTAESGTLEEKERVLAKWTKSLERPFLVATTALSEGFDYAHVRLVLNVNEPDSLVGFQQQSGRAGRDGRKAYSFVLLPADWKADRWWDGDLGTRAVSSREDLSLTKRRERQAMRRYLRGEQCFRTSLSEYLDAAWQRRWCMTEDVPCDVCQTSHNEPIEPPQVGQGEKRHTGLETIRQRQLQEQGELARYVEGLAAVRDMCVLCRAMEERWDHDFGQCRQRHAVFEQRRQTRRRHEEKGGQWLAAYSGCFWCLQPQGICRRAETGAMCEFGDVVLPVCYGVFHSGSGMEWLKREFGQRFRDVEGYMDWVGEESVLGGERATQGVRVAARKLREWGF